MLFNEASKTNASATATKKHDGLYEREWTKKYILFGHNISVHFIRFEFTNEETFRKEKDSLDLKNEFDTYNATLTLTVVSLFSTIYRPLSEASVYHEVEHAYQWCKNIDKNENYDYFMDAAYSYAVSIMNNPNANSFETVLAYLMYYSNPREQDAFVNEYYAQARDNAEERNTCSTQVEKRFKDYEALVKTFKNTINSPSFQPYIKQYEQYGYSANNILTYATKGLNRFKNKLNHVRALVREVVDFKLPYQEGIVDLLLKDIMED